MAQWTPSPPGRAFCMLPPRQCLPSQGRSIVESTPFSAWENFYVIIGSSAAALTGLQFVVVVLGAEARSIGPEVGAFGTPTVVHFCAALLISAILSVPWRAIANAGLALVAYVTLLVAAVVLQRDPPRTLLVIGATALFLLFIGIHNAWDAVTYIATQQPQHEERADRKKGRSA